ncbi:hypothetical protein Rs2_29842 [Raphanus sativus]|nr:hypothetical protein Rs2_29842 [Raphanus sativus]
MGEEAQDPLILGRPFLATAGAIVNVKEGKIDLHLGKENILHFDIKEKMRNPTVFGQAFTIEEMNPPPADDHFDELPPEEDENNGKVKLCAGIEHKVGHQSDLIAATHLGRSTWERHVQSERLRSLASHASGNTKTDLRAIYSQRHTEVAPAGSDLSQRRSHLAPRYVTHNPTFPCISHFHWVPHSHRDCVI